MGIGVTLPNLIISPKQTIFLNLLNTDLGSEGGGDN